MGSGKLVASWACSNKVLNGVDTCRSRHIREDVLIKTYLAVIKKITGEYDNVIRTIKESADILCEENIMAKLKEVSENIIEIQTDVMTLHRHKQDRIIDDSEYSRRLEEYREALRQNEKRQTEMQAQITKVAHIKDWIETFKEHLENANVEDIYESIVIKKLVKNIKMYDDKIVVEFHYGITVEQEYVK